MKSARSLFLSPPDVHWESTIVDAREVFEILIRENERMVLAFLRGVVGEADSLDLYQQTCLSAWKALGRYDRSRPFGPWLRGIASNLLLKHLRSRRGTVPLDEGVLQALEAKFEGLGRLPGDHWDEKLDSLRECLRSLAEEDRRLVDLYYRDGLSCPDIAGRSGEGIETVKKRLQRARLALSRCLEGKLAGALS